MNNIENLYEQIKNKYSRILNIKRNKAKRERQMYVLIYIVYILITLITFFIASKNNSDGAVSLFAIEILILPYLPMFIYKRWGKYVEYKKEYAKVIFKDMLNQFKEVKIYNHLKGIEKAKYKEARFTKRNYIYKSNCLAKGLIDEKFKFEMSNIYTKNIRLLSERTYIFDGTVIILEIPKNFKERIFITKQNILAFRAPNFLEDGYKIYCQNKPKNIGTLNLKLIKELLKTNLFDEIVIKNNKIYLRSFYNIFDIPKLKEELISKERITKFYIIFENILNNLNKIVKEI